MLRGSFKYRPLDTNEIRFVSFQPTQAEPEYDGAVESSSDPSLLECYIYRGPRNIHDLVALSYVWGLKEDIDRIRVNGHEVLVQANLKAALIAIRKQRPTVLLWIDALCINQADDIEKGREVGRMREIFQNAAQVIAWLGPASNSSDEILRKMTKIAKSWRSARSGPETIPSAIYDKFDTMSFDERSAYYMSQEARQDGWEEGTEMHILIHFTISDEAEADLPKTALEAFFDRPYWRRAWIIQEISLARNLYFQSGESCITYEDFQEVDKILGLRQVLAWSATDLLSHERKSLVYFYVKFRVHSSTFEHIRERSTNNKPIKIENLLIDAFAKRRAADSFEATDPRDRIYGLLGLASDCSIRADYTMSCSEVYTLLAEYVLTNGVTDILQYTKFPKKTSGLPSWVPD